ncbi:MAG TPA: flagellin [Pirellulales bacterium]|jgi:flagellin|nr:flagellin [Pirellulales bacterium]
MTRINTNVSSLVAQQNLAKSNTALQTALTRLSTGLRINTGADDPSGLIASQSLGSDITDVNAAISNSQQANELIATADSALSQVSSLLNDISGLVAQSANSGALSSDQISANQQQIDASLDAIDRIAETTSFGGRNLLDGSLGFITTSPGNVVTNASGSFGSVADAKASGTVASLLTISATAAGSDFNGDVVVVSGATDNASYTSGTLTITRSATATASDIATLINGTGSFSAVASSAGTVAEATYTGALAGGSNSNHITLSAASGGPSFNDVNVSLNIVSNGATAATYSSGTLTITASAGASAADIASAITAQGDFTATAANASGAYAASDSFSDVTTGGLSESNLSNLQISQANFGTASSLGVQIDIVSQATKAQLTYSGGALSSDVVLQIGGENGYQALSFGSGATVSQIQTAINQVSDATGVSASVNSGNLVLTSTAYGSNAFVSAKAISGTFNTSDANGRATGTDVDANINGVKATSDGLNVSLNNPTLNLSFAVDSHLQDGDTLNFSITGGGANFQLGPNVVSNQQARLGIRDISSATLNGASGSLFELRSGGDKDLTTDVNGGASIVNDVINAVTTLRGQLGAFQSTTLDTNINTLNDTLSNLTDAQSSIQDADFAVESANLTRAQILVQAGTTVLSIANQNPQNVLSLLKNA